ncbi:MAG TPA: multifunctional CCA tRNA nucleotidyl transferase/2'3'-cyclic phosphodiesterase/2'nucleotidase/phosphatase [Burkholderiaceae bacterium]|nr:multifunctional CCA tRNA nucleotidyl transferase/2'3'-cyclic phosphodiesterase/2'nucleotidase/phosphatase [Burkholderiaceae bacterium]
MKAYVVGGAVRDRLLGETVRDRDWVVVGATPEQLVAAGYTPVGREFPVFLHPVTHEQYALARTERKAGRGYRGFVFHAAPDVTLEQDLERRDLTINAIAEDPDGGGLIDPFGGRRDLEQRVLRHVSPAFADDPVRLLRVARFAARWPGFSIADDTQALLLRLVTEGEVDALVPERVWQEVAHGLCEARPSRMFELLRAWGALARLAPTLDIGLADVAPRQWSLRALDAAPPRLRLRFACLCHALDTTAGGTTDGQPRLRALCERWRVDNDCRELALLAARERPLLQRGDAAFEAPQCLALLQRCDAWRRPERLEDALVAFGALAAASDDEAVAGTLRQRCALVRRGLHAAAAVRVASLPAPLRERGGTALGRALRDARLQAITLAFART